MVEMTIALPVIFMLFSGLIEFGFMLNDYLSLLDATRTAARDFSSLTPFNTDGSDNIAFYYTDTSGDPSLAYGAAGIVESELAPTTGNPDDNSRKTVLDPATDDVIVSVFSVVNPSTIDAFPTAGAFPGAMEAYPGAGYDDYHWNAAHPITPSFTKASLQNQLVAGGPCEGVVVVEVAWTYHQVLNLPWMAALGSPVLHAYSIMPLQAAEPVGVGTTGSPQLPTCP